ncbi:MAG: phosphatidylserine decarboxylase [Phycisphaerae bacterium]
MKFTKYAKTEVLVFSLALAGDLVGLIVLTTVLYLKISPFVALIAGLAYTLTAIPVMIFLLLFFRDPDRRPDREKIPSNVMLAPADGKITEITNIDDPRVGGPALKIGIFLSVFNVHINRSPCDATVLESTHKQGEFLNAMNLDSSHRNECNDMLLEPVDPSGRLPNRIVVRQIAGLIAKRIVCAVKPGDVLTAGRRFGMIKFGSRTELIVPAASEPKIMVKLGQSVHAGDDVLLIY